MTKQPSVIDDLTYEQALAELETLLSALESETKDLETTMTLFERGKALISHCQQLLEKAELKVRQLTDDGGLIDLEERE